jgi:hypothetical protein
MMLSARQSAEMKLLRWFEWIAFAASALLLLYVAYVAGTSIYALGSKLINPCDMAYGNSAENGRGDVLEGQTRDCALIGSAAQDRIGFKLADEEDFVALVYYGMAAKAREPAFSWVDDDHLTVDLGEVDWLTPQIRQRGHVTISFTYSGAAPTLE